MIKKLIVVAFLLSIYPGHAGDETVETTWKQDDLVCLASTIHFEARGESQLGKRAVGYVVLNRVKSGKFPNSICGVVKQKTGKFCQFSWVCKPQKTPKISKAITDIAIKLLENGVSDPTHGALFFHNDSVDSFTRKRTTVIGNHIFYR